MRLEERMRKDGACPICSVELLPHRRLFGDQVFWFHTEVHRNKALDKLMVVVDRLARAAKDRRVADSTVRQVHAEELRAVLEEIDRIRGDDW